MSSAAADELARRKREQVEAEAALDGELRAATQGQLQELRRALTGELQSADGGAIERLVSRLLRLVLRVLSLGLLELPASPEEQRALAARHALSRVGAELRRRAEVVGARVRLGSGAPPTPAAAPAPPAPRRIVRGHDARQQQAEPALDEQEERERAARSAAERNWK